MITILQARFVFWKHLSALALKLVDFAIKRMNHINDKEEHLLEIHRRDQENAESGD